MNKQHNLVLTKAQQRVYDLAITGLSASEMAITLHLSEASIKFHLANLRQKFEVNSTAALIALHYMGKEAFWENRVH
ncbi:MAG: hypothetical protein AXW14_08605 [Alteromonas sp. Nap_26]|nr:MAG: hypothetical protein AXW14_08605 [Alteromonas sp. Nap_26]